MSAFHDDLPIKRPDPFFAVIQAVEESTGTETITLEEAQNRKIAKLTEIVGQLCRHLQLQHRGTFKIEEIL